MAGEYIITDSIYVGSAQGRIFFYAKACTNLQNGRIYNAVYDRTSY